MDAIAALAGANKRLLYHYFGNKEDLYRAVLLDAYQEIRRGERALSLDQYGPVDAMDRLVRFTFRHFLANPWFPRLLGTENIENARFLKTLPDIQALHSPLVGQIRTIVERGAVMSFRDYAQPARRTPLTSSISMASPASMRCSSVMPPGMQAEPSRLSAGT